MLSISFITSLFLFTVSASRAMDEGLSKLMALAQETEEQLKNTDLIGVDKETICDTIQDIEDDLENEINYVSIICICQEKFGSDDELMNHIKDCHNELSGISVIYKCPQIDCNESFWSIKHFMKHMKTHANNYVCSFPECNESFKHLCKLNTHIKTHTKPVVCTFECGKTFASIYHRKLHEGRAHTYEKPYPCRIENCKASFVEDSARNVHEIRHSGIKCNFVGCEYFVSDVFRFRKHLIRKHFYCKICERHFDSREQALGHEKAYKTKHQAISRKNSKSKLIY